MQVIFVHETIKRTLTIQPVRMCPVHVSLKWINFMLVLNLIREMCATITTFWYVRHDKYNETIIRNNSLNNEACLPHTTNLTCVVLYNMRVKWIKLIKIKEKNKDSDCVQLNTQIWIKNIQGGQSKKETKTKKKQKKQKTRKTLEASRRRTRKQRRRRKRRRRIQK